MPSGPKGGDKTCLLKEGKWKEAGNTLDGRDFQRREVEGKKPSLNRLILALESSTQQLWANGCLPCGIWTSHWRWNTGDQFIRAVSKVIAVEKK